MKNSLVEWIAIVIVLFSFILMLVHIGDVGTGTNNVEKMLVSIKELYIKAVTGSFF